MSEKTPIQDSAAEGLIQPLYVPIKRRSFFMYAGATAGATALVLSGCSDDDDENNNPSNGVTDVGDLGANDVGVLNYAYALEQLEAAFYAQVLTGGYFTNAATPAGEKQIFTDLALHEKIHADFFKTALAGNAIKGLNPDFTKIDFALRNGTANGKMGVLDAAKAFEDLGVAAYNGAGRYISNANNLTLAGKIVSVEARHAALIRDLLNPGTFVGNDVVDFSLTSNTARQEKSKTPTEVVAIANTFLMADSQISATKLVG